MGLAAWMRAVALPLTALSLGYWLGRRTRWPAALALTGAAVLATLVVLAPWAARNARASGHVYFTDDHGGLTALIGANPNSEGTYTRALNQMFHDLTGKSVLDEPHHEVDQAAYALAKDWTRFEPAYALGLSAKRAERLFDDERYLLYWSVFRPGVLVGAPATWFAARRETVSAAVGVFGAVLAALAAAGVVLAAARRRWPALALVPFQLALAATYVLFFAEPRYRLPIELLALPFAALTLVELGALAAALARRAWRPGAHDRGRARRRGGLRARGDARLARAARRRRGPARGHRWAADVWRVDGAAAWRSGGPSPRPGLVARRGRPRRRPARSGAPAPLERPRPRSISRGPALAPGDLARRRSTRRPRRPRASGSRRRKARCSQTWPSHPARRCRS